MGDVDDWLVRAAADRDEGAFEQLVRQHTAVLYAGALRATGSVQLAEEVVQDAWLSAWLHLPGFRGQSTVRTWLVRIVTTTALNAVRRRQVTVPLDQLGDPVHPEDVAWQAEQHERAAAVRAAVAALPVRQREAVVLRDLEGLSYQEVAGELSCTVASVKSALHHGRAGLARALAAYRPDETDPTPGAGPSGAGPSSAGPSSAGPSSAGPSSAGPSSAGPSSAGPSGEPLVGGNDE